MERFFTKDNAERVIWEWTDIVLKDKNSKDLFNRRCEFPTTWSYNAKVITASKYFTDDENSLKQVIARIVETITCAGIKQKTLDALDITIFQDELTAILTNQIAAFNSPVWFNIGVKNRVQQGSACQPYNSLVMTLNGLMPIGKLVDDNAIGTKIIDAKGISEIIATKYNGLKEVIRIHTRAGYKLDVTSDHLVWKAVGSENNDGKFIPAGDLSINDALTLVRHEPKANFESSPILIAEAALAGWLQSDGFVGQYPNSKNPSLIIEAMTINDDEHKYVLDAIKLALPDQHYWIRDQETKDQTIDCKRIRMSGKSLENFVEKWNLRPRRLEMHVPECLFTAPLDMVSAYIRSIFQAEGFVVRCTEKNRRGVGIQVSMISKELIYDIQKLLLRFGIYSRVNRNKEKRKNRQDTYSICIKTGPDRRLFAKYIGFVSKEKNEKLESIINIDGINDNKYKRLQINFLESLGSKPVYDIQTTSGEYISEGLRVHNCFLLDVEDNMESILEWITTEGLIFRGGSGSGINISKLRAKDEPIGNRGTSSGPLSFMAAADGVAGAIKSGGAVRRAAKMVIMDVDHPDIIEFIECKKTAENILRKIEQTGENIDVNSDILQFIPYQNANNSVSVTDEFMERVQNNQGWSLIPRKETQPDKIVKAKEIFRKIAEIAWECGDPGIFYHDTANKWNTCKNSDEIITTNPCGEHVFITQTPCNLASINLLKFLDHNNNFEIDKFIYTVKIMITAMDILVSYSEYPTEKIKKAALNYRTIGLGYSNLGALLMCLGIPYDSNEGRIFATAITSLMTSVAYSQSGELALKVSPFLEYEKNKEPFHQVMNKHYDAHCKLEQTKLKFSNLEIILSNAYVYWNHVIHHTGFRNAQVTLLAPTGTISFAMDCSTTGVEPELSLIKYKTLVGGGSLKIVNQDVERALTKLGYKQNDINVIHDFIQYNNTLENCLYFNKQDLPVFDCSFKGGGKRSISPMGHIEMVAAIQPFLSSGISKTINVPHEATVDDIEDIYMEAWKLGLKAISIYRDGSKVAQPLKSENKKKQLQLPLASQIEITLSDQPLRKRLPNTRTSVTHKFNIAGHEGYITVGLYPDKKPGEIFVTMAKEGSTISGLMDAFATSISIGLQHGVPLRSLVDKFKYTRFEPSGFTENDALKTSSSIVDYIFRWLELEFLNYKEEEVVNPVFLEFISAPDSQVKQTNGDLCLICGGMLIQAGSCKTCSMCGLSTGCG